MSNDTEKMLATSWQRYEVPETGVSAEFPEEPFLDEEDDEEDGDEGDGSLALSLVFGKGKGTINFDLVVTPGQELQVASSDTMARQLRKELAADRDLELLGVEPRSCGELCGAVQRMQLRGSGDFLTQWVIAAPERTIYVGVTSLDVQSEALVERFFGSVEVEGLGEDEGE